MLGILKICSLIWGNPILRYGAMVFVALLSFKGWLWTHDNKVEARLERKANIHVTEAVAEADNITRAIAVPVERLRRDYCDNC